MKKAKNVILMILIFLAALAGSFFLVNYHPQQSTQELSEATLPVLYTVQDGQKMNEMHGYRSEMEISTMRDAIEQLHDGYQAELLFDTYGTEVESVSCTVYSRNSEEKLGEARTGELTKEGEQVKTTLDFSGLLLDDLEYQAVVTAKLAGEDVSYYFRVASFPDADYDACLAYVRNFHDITLNKSRAKELADSLEPVWNADEGSFSHVDIHNSADTVCWGDLAVSEAAEPVITAKEVNAVYTAFEIRYPAVTEENGAKRYYDVCEYFRVRSAASHIYLLDYERTAEELFDGTAEAGATQIRLGIRPEALTMDSNAAANVVCFLQAGDLWLYREDGNEFTRIMSTRQKEGFDADARDDYHEHGIRLIRIDESGNTDFIVYGYMNRGEHEGYSGISVCHYDVLDDAVTEKFFIPQKTSYQQMKERIGNTMYLTDEGVFYFCAGDKLYRIRPDGSSQEEIASGMSHIRASGNGRHIAWTDADQGQKTERMHIMDLDSGEDTPVEAEEGTYVRSLGFLEEDCIYGIATGKDLKKSGSGEIFPMSEIRIIDTQEGQELKKSITKKKLWFTDASVSAEGTINLKAWRYQDGAFVEDSPVTVANNEIVARAKITAEEISDEVSRRQMVLSLTSPVPAFAVNLVIPQIAYDRKNRGSVLDESLFASDYYIYARGGVAAARQSLSSAIQTADENAGLVVDQKQNLIWSRAKETYRNPMNLGAAGGKSRTAKAVNVMLSAMGTKPSKTDKKLKTQTVFEILTEAQGAGKVMDLTGCTLSEVLYYVDQNTPVLARLSKDRLVLVCGYTGSEVWYYDPDRDETARVLLTEAEKDFADGGNQFYAYLRNS